MTAVGHGGGPPGEWSPPPMPNACPQADHAPWTMLARCFDQGAVRMVDVARGAKGTVGNSRMGLVAAKAAG